VLWADDGERGGATSVEMALLWIAMLAMIGAVVQVALVFYADQLASTAAQDGVRTGRNHDTVSAEQARRAAEGFLGRTAGTALADTAVTAEIADAGGTLRVRVTGRALSMIPGVELAVDRQAVGAVERVAP
jgi:Flp pilus assembly protein TadG